MFVFDWCFIVCVVFLRVGFFIKFCEVDFFVFLREDIEVEKVEGFMGGYTWA